MNTEKMVVRKTDNGKYINSLLVFCGTAEEARAYAATHNYGGGVEVYNLRTKKFQALNKEATK